MHHSGELNRPGETELIVDPESLDTYQLREKARRIAALLPRGAGRILLVGAGPALASALTRGGGEWVRAQWAALAEEPQRGSEVHLLRDGRFPFGDGEFGAVVLADVLEYVPDETSFVRECHRILAENGRLVIHGRHLKRWGLLNALRRLLRLEEDQRLMRRGYTQTTLFDVVKDGFNIELFEAYSRFPSEAVALLAVLLLSGTAGEEPHRELRRRTALALGWLGKRLDFLALGTRGYRFVASARRRVWRPRRSPVLRDGRTIAEAALGGKIGTAAPF